MSKCRRQVQWQSSNLAKRWCQSTNSQHSHSPDVELKEEERDKWDRSGLESRQKTAAPLSEKSVSHSAGSSSLRPQGQSSPGDCPSQAPLSTGLSRQAYWSGLPFPFLGDLPHPEIEPTYKRPWRQFQECFKITAGEAQNSKCQSYTLQGPLLFYTIKQFSKSIVYPSITGINENKIF